MATQKTPKNQNNLEKKQSWSNQYSWLPTILQNYSNQNIRVLAQNQTQMCGTEQRAASREINPHLHGQLVTKEARTYNGEKTASSMLGQLGVKQTNWIALSHHAQK